MADAVPNSKRIDKDDVAQTIADFIRDGYVSSDGGKVGAPND